LPAPTGPHGIGRIGFTVDDPVRREIFTPDPSDTRRFPVWVYYPSAAGGCAPHAYFPPELGAAYSASFGLRSGFEQSVLAHHCVGTRIAADKARYPVILFSHGLGNTHLSYLSIIEDLVSHGNIVIAADHTHGPSLTYFPDGSSVKRDSNRFGASGDPGYFQRAMIEHSRFWAEDMSRALERIVGGEVAQLPRTIRTRMDLDRVVYFGHSYGGLAAVHAARVDSRIKGAVNLDGLVMNRYAVPVTADVPLLVLNSEKRDETGTYMPAARVISVRGSHHSTFADLQWLSDHFATQQPPQQPALTGLYSIQMTREVLRLFLGCVLERRCEALDDKLKQIRLVRPAASPAPVAPEDRPSGSSPG
jgi:pimeloyl-ACP methyl ester carboxylesterase